MNWFAFSGITVVVLGLLAAARFLPAYRRRKSYDIQVFPGFLSPEECAHLIERAEPLMKKSQVYVGGGNAAPSSSRFSGSAIISQAGDQMIQDIKKRIAKLSNTHFENQERIQVTHYFSGDRFERHLDSLSAGKVTLGPSGDRYCTVLIYLNDDYEGGFTSAASTPIILRREAASGAAQNRARLDESADPRSRGRESRHSAALKEVSVTIHDTCSFPLPSQFSVNPFGRWPNRTSNLLRSGFQRSVRYEIGLSPRAITQEGLHFKR
jgi:hypothetical protein